jgi:hypothetical protein
VRSGTVVTGRPETKSAGQHPHAGANGQRLTVNLHGLLADSVALRGVAGAISTSACANRV